MRVSFPIFLYKNDPVEGSLKSKATFNCSDTSIGGYYINDDNEISVIVDGIEVCTEYDKVLVDELDDILNTPRVNSKYFYRLLNKIEILINNIEPLEEK